MYQLDKDKIKNSLTIQQVFELVNDMGGEPRIENENTLVSKTICHNRDGTGSHKLYYYDNTKLFHCYSGCDNDTFDIYELICKVNEGFSLHRAIIVVATYCGIPLNVSPDEEYKKLDDWAYLNSRDKESKNPVMTGQSKLNNYDTSVIEHYPHPHIECWEQEGIKKSVMDECGIAYDPVAHGIIIPHYDMDNNLVGVRERTLIKDEEANGKYKPAYLHGKMFNHPLGFNLYNLNKSKDNIRNMRKAIIYEGEKSNLLMRSYFGANGDISVASCGSSVTYFQVMLLLNLGVDEIIIAYDKQFKEMNDDEFKLWTKKLSSIYNKYKNYCQISFLFDNQGLLGYKDSPIDRGPDVFMELFKNRIFLKG